MLEINVKINTIENVNISFVRKKSIAEIIKVESNFEIFIDNKLYFSEPNFPILELLIQLLDWINNPISSFNYKSIESDDFPILSFKLIDNNFKIFSCWERFSSENIFSTDEINEIIKKIYDNTDKSIISLHNISLKDLDIIL